MDSGELCVMTHLIAGMLTLYVDNWDTLELWPMITCHSKHVCNDYLVNIDHSMTLDSALHCIMSITLPSSASVACGSYEQNPAFQLV